MRNVVWITTAVAALVLTGVGIAHGFDSKSIKAVSATFTASTVGNVSSSTCTATDGSYTTTRAEYTGTSTSTEPSLNGPATLDAVSVINTTTGYGIVTGSLRFGAGGDNRGTRFESVLTNGALAGFTEGRSSDAAGELFSNLSASFTAAGGFTNGKIGGGTSGGNGVLVTSGGCQTPPAPQPDKVGAHGAVSAISSTSITVAGVTCTIPTNLQATVAGLNLVVGSQTSISCTVSGGTNTLAQIAQSNGKGGGGNEGQGHSLLAHTLTSLGGRHDH